MSAPPDKITELFHSAQSCISHMKTLATANMFKLNDNTAELNLVTSKRTQHLRNLPTDRHCCLKFGNIPKNEGGQISLHPCKKSYDLHEIRPTKKKVLLEQMYFTGGMPLLTPNHSFKTCDGWLQSFQLNHIFFKMWRKTEVGMLGMLHPKNP